MAGSMRVKGGSKGDVKGKGKAKKSSAIAGPSRPAARVPEVVEQDEEKVELEEDAEEAVELEGDQEDDASGSEDGDGEDDRDHSAKQTQEQLEHQDATASEEDAEDGASDEHDAEGDAEGDAEEDKPRATFESLGLIPQICQACSLLNFKFPSEIQAETIPYALQGKDIIGLAQTGSGKTAAFALPVIQALYNDPAPFFCCVLAPTRELAYQISEQFTALGSTIGVRCVVLVGGMDMMEQSIALGKRPHVIVATPGRLQDHLENTKGFSLRSLKYLVMDEADRLLDMDFGPAIDKILKVIPRERNTYLFSATMTTKVAKLQRASLSNPVKLEVSSKYSTVSTLIQHYLFIPLKHKDTYLVYLANELSGRTMIIFTRTVHDASRVALLLRHLGFPAIPLHGQLSQSHRLGALNKFKSGGRTILVATDVASRGLDIPLVDYVINYDIPTHSKDYIHRVGRTARAGRAGKSITLATQYDVELLQRIEGVIGKKMTEFPSDKEQVLMLAERVGEAQREAAKELRDENSRNGGKGRNGKRRAQDAHDDKDRDDDMVEAGGGGMKRRKVMNKRRR